MVFEIQNHIFSQSVILILLLRHNKNVINSLNPMNEMHLRQDCGFLSTNSEVKEVHGDTFPILPVSQNGQTEIPRITRQFRDVFQSHYLIRQCTKILALIRQA